MALSALAVAVLAAAPGVQAQNVGTFTIDGTSTVRSWKCSVPHTLATSPVAGADEVLAGESAVQAVIVTVDVAAIDCGNGKMNDHLRNALKAKEHPTIEYRLSSYDLARAEPDVQATVHGTLTIAGATEPITLQVGLAKDASGALRAAGQQQLAMTKFGVKPPSLMMGTMKVGDEVRVSFDVLVAPQSGNGIVEVPTSKQRN